MAFARILLRLRQSLKFLRAEAVSYALHPTRRCRYLASHPSYWSHSLQTGSEELSTWSAIYSSPVAPEDGAIGVSGQFVATPAQMLRTQFRPRRESAGNVRCQLGRIAADSRNSFRTSGYPRTMHPDTVEVLRVAMRLTIRDCSSTRYISA